MVIHNRSVIIRCESTADESAVRTVNESAFERFDEANLIDNLRKEGAVVLSLIAEVKRQVVGHILFSRMWIDNSDGSLAAIALAPISVLPAHQRKGIGGMLIRSGLECLRDQGERIVIVLGHPNYYRHFGFSTEQARGLTSPFPPDAFMAAELSTNAMLGISGNVRYPVAFGL